MSRRVSLIYDGHCAFCIAWLDRLKRLDANKAIGLFDSHDAGIRERFPQLENANLDDAMFAIDDDGRVTAGFDAFRTALGAIDAARWWAWSWWIPGVPPVGRAVYRYIARNRYRYGCDSTCAVNASNRGST